MILALVFNGVLVTTCLYAGVRGGRPERIGAGINLVASCVTTALRLTDARYYAPAEFIILSIDALVIAVFYWLAVSTTRFWPIWAFGFAVANVFVSVAGGLIPRTPMFAYHSGLGLYAYLALASLALGTFRIPRSASLATRDGRRALGFATPIFVVGVGLSSCVARCFRREPRP